MVYVSVTEQSRMSKREAEELEALRRRRAVEVDKEAWGEDDAMGRAFRMHRPRRY